LKVDLAKTTSQLKRAILLFRDEWKFDVPPPPTSVNGKKLTTADLKALPIANAPGEVTLVGAFGAAVLQSDRGQPCGNIIKVMGGQSLDGNMISVSKCVQSWNLSALVSQLLFGPNSLSISEWCTDIVRSQPLSM
jgi:hypothetical protein